MAGTKRIRVKRKIQKHVGRKLHKLQRGLAATKRQSPIEDDIYAIQVAQSEYREAFITGDVDRLLRVFQPGFTDMSVGVPSFYDEDAVEVLHRRMSGLFDEFHAQLAQAVMVVEVSGRTAYSYGLRALTLRPKRGGTERRTHFRFFELWKKNANGKWKLDMVIDNAEPPLALPGVVIPIPWFEPVSVSEENFADKN